MLCTYLSELTHTQQDSQRDWTRAKVTDHFMTAVFSFLHYLSPLTLRLGITLTPPSNRGSSIFIPLRVNNQRIYIPRARPSASCNCIQGLPQLITSKMATGDSTSLESSLPVRPRTNGTDSFEYDAQLPLSPNGAFC